MRHLWFLFPIVVTAAVVTPELVRWVMEVMLGGATIAGGFTEVLKYTSLAGYAFFGVFRAVPYAALAALLVVVALNRTRPYVWPIFIGGYTATTWFIVTGFWGAQRAYYTGEHVSSTTALAFVFVPIFACIPMVVGALGATVPFAIARFVLRLVRRRGPA